MMFQKISDQEDYFNFFGLLFCLLCLMLIGPLVKGFTGTVLIEILFALILLLSIYMISNNLRIFLIGAALLVPAEILSWTFLFDPADWIKLTSYLLMSLFLVLVTAIFSLKVFFAKEARAYLVHGALCIYLLVGVLFAVLYNSLEIATPGTFISSGRDLAPENFHDFLYYSYITLTTLGYGDITPTAPLARSLASLEAILGQFYIATLVASLVVRIMSQPEPEKKPH